MDIPTGRVAAELVIHLVIEELGAAPKRTDWREVLDASLSKFEQWRTWPASRAHPN